MKKSQHASQRRAARQSRAGVAQVSQQSEMLMLLEEQAAPPTAYGDIHDTPKHIINGSSK